MRIEWNVLTSWPFCFCRQKTAYEMRIGDWSSVVCSSDLGVVAVPPGAAPATLTDRHHVIEVILASAEVTLSNAGDALLDGGANLALVGDELLQFGRAEQIDATRWRLSRLWRGRRGTEAAIGTPAAGDRFGLLKPGTRLALDVL